MLNYKEVAYLSQSEFWTPKNGVDISEKVSCDRKYFDGAIWQDFLHPCDSFFTLKPDINENLADHLI